MNAHSRSTEGGLFKSGRRLCLIFAAVGIFAACSSSVPKIGKSDCYVLFSYDSGISLPDISVSCFITVSSPVERVSNLRLFHNGRDLEWTMENPSCVSHDGETWIGSARLRVPSHCSLPVGDYTISMMDANLEKDSVPQKLTYPSIFLGMTFSEVQHTIPYLELTGENLAIYDANEGLLYFGEAKKSLGNEDMILSNFPDAASYRICRSNPIERYAVLEPPSKIFGAQNFAETEGDNGEM